MDKKNTLANPENDSMNSLKMTTNYSSKSKTFNKSEKTKSEISKSKIDINARSYAQIMDQHAEHILYARNGLIIQETPEFESFKRVAENFGIWAQLIIYLNEIQIYCRILKEKLLKVNGSILLRHCA